MFLGRRSSGSSIPSDIISRTLWCPTVVVPARIISMSGIRNGIAAARPSQWTFRYLNLRRFWYRRRNSSNGTLFSCAVSKLDVKFRDSFIFRMSRQGMCSFDSHLPPAVILQSKQLFDTVGDLEDEERGKRAIRDPSIRHLRNNSAHAETFPLQFERSHQMGSRVSFHFKNAALSNCIPPAWDVLLR